MQDLVENPEDRFSCVAAQIALGFSEIHGSFVCKKQSDES